MPGLQIDGVRATRARYPNLPGGIEVSPGYGAMISSGDAAWTLPDFNRLTATTFNVPSPFDHHSITFYHRSITVILPLQVRKGQLLHGQHQRARPAERRLV